jgi:hypothetical protein
MSAVSMSSCFRLPIEEEEEEDGFLGFFFRYRGWHLPIGSV